MAETPEEKAFRLAQACIEAANGISKSVENRKRKLSITKEIYFDNSGIYVLPSIYCFTFDHAICLRLSFLFWDFEISFSR